MDRKTLGGQLVANFMNELKAEARDAVIEKTAETNANIIQGTIKRQNQVEQAQPSHPLEAALLTQQHRDVTEHGIDVLGDTVGKDIVEEAVSEETARQDNVVYKVAGKLLNHASQAKRGPGRPPKS